MQGKKNMLTEATDIPHVSPRFAIVAISIFLAFLILPMILWGALKMIPGGTDVFDVELEENRKLFEMPDQIDAAKLTAHLEAYFNDRIPFRNLLIYSYQQITSAVEIPYKQELRPLLIQLLYPSSTSTPPPNQPPQDPNQDLIFGSDTQDTTVEGEPLPEPTVEVAGDDACDHILDSGELLSPATCEADGWGRLRRTCTVCGHVRIEFTPKADHQLEQISQRKATCLINGTTVFECTVCHETVTETEKAGHISSRVLTTVEPSYTDYGYTLHRCGRCFGEYRTDIVEKLYDDSILPLSYLSAGNGYAAPIEGKQKWLFYSGDNTLDYYQKTNEIPDSQLARYAALLQELYDLAAAQGKQVQIMVMPLREHIYAEYMPTVDVNEGSNRVQKNVKYMKTHLGIEIVYPYDELLAAKPYWQTYYRLDTHWTAAGGFVGTQALYRALGMETVSMYNLPILERAADRDSKYDLVWRSGSDEAYYGEDVDYFIDYKPEVSVLEEWIEPGNDQAEPYDDIRIVRTNSDNDCHFVMIADSYRLNMEPYLEKDFSDCLFTHRRRVNEEPVRNAILDSDVIVIAAAERLENEIWDTVQQIVNILKSNQAST